MNPWYKSSTFWTHAAVTTSAAATGLSTVFNASFLNAHPLVAAAITVSSILCIAVSQASYVVAKAVTRHPETPSATPIA